MGIFRIQVGDVAETAAFLLVSMVVLCTTGTCQLESETFSKQNHATAPSTEFGDLGQTTNARSVIACGSLCLRTTDCSDFLYKRSLNGCQMLSSDTGTTSVQLSDFSTWDLYLGPIVCSYVYIPELNKCVEFETSITLTWWDARDECIARNAHLVVASTDAEFQYFRSYIQSDFPGKSFHVGGSHLSETTFHWFNGDIVKQEFFAPSQPDNKFGDEYCLAFRDSDNYLLNDIGCCCYPIEFICEYTL